jgi:hypothetical protein
LDDKLPPQMPVAAGPADPLAQRFCDALHALPAARKAQCCGGGSSVGLASECTRVLSDAVARGAVRLDREAVERCAQSSERQLSGCGWVRPQPPLPPAACREVIAGQLLAAAKCRSSLECAAGLHCSGSGACAAPEGPGAACGRRFDLLTSYTGRAVASAHPDCAGYCHRGMCANLVALGEACLTSSQCGPGRRCSAGTCTEGLFAELGAACSGSECPGGAVCLSGKCVALKEAGALCWSPFECRGWCIKKAGAEQGSCGMQCGPTSGFMGR